jgi:hypothetical protein
MKTLSASHKSSRIKIFYNLFIILTFIFLLPSTGSAICITEEKLPDGTIRKITRIIIYPDGTKDPVDNAYFYSDTVSIDSSYTPSITGSSGIGAWSYEYITTDHNGGLLPGGVEGIHFYLTSGDGISNGEYADFSFAA